MHLILALHHLTVSKRALILIQLYKLCVKQQLAECCRTCDGSNSCKRGVNATEGILDIIVTFTIIIGNLLLEVPPIVIFLVS